MEFILFGIVYSILLGNQKFIKSIENKKYVFNKSYIHIYTYHLKYNINLKDTFLVPVSSSRIASDILSEKCIFQEIGWDS